jgi:hypothetical protein
MPLVRCVNGHFYAESSDCRACRRPPRRKQQCNYGHPSSRYKHYAGPNGSVNGSCLDCNKNANRSFRSRHPEAQHRYYLRWKDKNPESYRRRLDISHESKRQLKEELIAAYGGCCACCGESTFEFLSIDHTDQVGRRHRREVKGGHNIYKWLKKRGFPRAGFQLLCFNCNSALGFYGNCPHTETTRPVIRKGGAIQ